MNLKLKKPYEIGSHFALENKGAICRKEKEVKWLPHGDDYSYTFSGRTAIEHALMDILINGKITNVYMPSYCCTSMTQPFIDKNIKIMYYNVYYDSTEGIRYEIDTSIECDIFFAMSYFGLEDFSLNYAIEVFSKRGSIIIEDITHRLLSNNSHSVKANYSIASIRKWLPIPSGGYIVKHNGLLSDKPNINSEDVVLQKIEAMKEKHLFLQGGNISKESFLTKFVKFEQELNNINITYKIDNLSLSIIRCTNIDEVKFRRRKNGKVLYEGLCDFDFIEPLIPNPDFEEHCPLFIPIMIGNGKRDSLRQYLIEHKVYCPVHWPNNICVEKGIQESELSLICDQRYTEKDMEYILGLIRQWSCKSSKNNNITLRK